MLDYLGEEYEKDDVKEDKLTRGEEENKSIDKSSKKDNEDSAEDGLSLPSPTSASFPVLKKYQSIKGDEIDEAMARIVNNLNIKLPIIRIGNGKYLIGTESKIAVIKGNSCVVRIGGGFQNMEEYIVRHESEELEKIKKLMQ